MRLVSPAHPLVGQLRFELEILQIRGMMCKMRGVAKVDDKLVAEADMGAVVRDV